MRHRLTPPAPANPMARGNSATVPETTTPRAAASRASPCAPKWADKCLSTAARPVLAGLLMEARVGFLTSMSRHSSSLVTTGTSGAARTVTKYLSRAQNMTKFIDIPTAYLTPLDVWHRTAGVGFVLLVRQLHQLQKFHRSASAG